MYDYGHEVLRANPVLNVKNKTQPFQGERESIEHHERPLNPHFQMMYIYYKACRDIFQVLTHIGLYGCFLKGYYKGQILAAIGRDPNGQMLPIAFVFMEGEIKDSWSWFLELLIAYLGGVRLCNTYTFISDQQNVHFLSSLLFYLKNFSFLICLMFY